jgi:RNA polymerase sigma-70 factor, ECF subfamily
LKPIDAICFPWPTACSAVRWMLRIWCRRPICGIRRRRHRLFTRCKPISPPFSPTYVWINSGWRTGSDPEKRVEREESISLAFLVLLEHLQPFERAVFLLHEVFAYSFAEIANMLEKSEAACRRSFSRAKQHLIEQRPRFTPAPETHRQLLTSFQEAVGSGDMTTLTHILAEKVILWTDGGGRPRKALLRPIQGREAVTRMTLASKRIWPENAQVEFREVNGQTALVVRVDGRAWSCLSIEVEQGQIQVIRIMLNPDKLTQV